MLLTGAASIEVGNSEQASDVDVEMKDADLQQGNASKPGGEGEASKAAAHAKGSVTGDEEALVRDAVKLETADKVVRDIAVDEDLVCAFRYFDKTGNCCEPPSCYAEHMLTICLPWHSDQCVRSALHCMFLPIILFLMTLCSFVQVLDQLGLLQELVTSRLMTCVKSCIVWACDCRTVR